MSDVLNKIVAESSRVPAGKNLHKLEKCNEKKIYEQRNQTPNE